MRTLQLISPSGPYGAESMMINLAEALQTLDCESVLGLFRNSQNPCDREVARLAAGAGLPVEIISCRGSVDLHALEQIKDCIRRHRLELVHSHGVKTDLYGYLAARATCVPIVATYHCSLKVSRIRLKWRWYRAADLLLLRRFDKVIAVSEAICAGLRDSGIRGARLGQIRNGVNVAVSPAEPAADIRSAGRAIVGFVARLIPEKGPEHFLRAAKRVLQTFPDTTFYLVGSGPHRPALESLARELQIAGHVVFAGLRQDMPAVYAALDIMALPSLSEGLPMTVLEALAAGRAVVATAVGGIPSVIRDGETGLLIPPADSDALAGAIERLLRAPELRKKVGQCGRRLVEEQFSSNVMAKEYLAIYADLLSSPQTTCGRIPYPANEPS